MKLGQASEIHDNRLVNKKPRTGRFAKHIDTEYKEKYVGNTCEIVTRFARVPLRIPDS